MPKLRLLKDWVQVRLCPLPERAGLIHRVDAWEIIPDPEYAPHEKVGERRQELVREADVLSTGPGCREVQVEDCVLVSVLKGHEIGGELLVPENAILGWVEHD